MRRKIKTVKEQMDAETPDDVLADMEAKHGSMQRLVRGQLRNQLHEFVDSIVRHCEDPSCWPLTQTEQIVFVRTVIYQAMKISQSEAYMADAVDIAAEQLAKAS